MILVHRVVILLLFLYEADLDKQLDDVDVPEVAEEESSDVNADGNDGSKNEELEQENKESDEKMDEQQTEEVSTKCDFIISLWYYRPQFVLDVFYVAYMCYIFAKCRLCSVKINFCCLHGGFFACCKALFVLLL